MPSRAGPDAASPPRPGLERTDIQRRHAKVATAVAIRVTPSFRAVAKRSGPILRVPWNVAAADVSASRLR